jgi:hypothetical protein
MDSSKLDELLLLIKVYNTIPRNDTIHYNNIRINSNLISTIRNIVCNICGKNIEDCQGKTCSMGEYWQ